LNQHKSFTS